jgi:hypothetical protein
MPAQLGMAPLLPVPILPDGAVAQLGERRVRNAKVGSSILLGSTISLFLKTAQTRRRSGDIPVRGCEGETPIKMPQSARDPFPNRQCRLNPESAE